MGCKTDMCSPPLAATLNEGVRHMIIKAETHEGPLRCTGRRKGALRMLFVSQRSAPFRPVRRPGWTRGAFVWQLLWSVTRGPCRLLMAESASAHLVGVGRRQLLRVPKTMADGTDWEAVGAKKCGIKRGGWWGL